MEILDADFRGCKGGSAALRRLVAYAEEESAAVLPPSVIKDCIPVQPRARRPPRSHARPLSESAAVRADQALAQGSEENQGRRCGSGDG